VRRRQKQERQQCTSSVKEGRIAHRVVPFETADGVARANVPEKDLAVSTAGGDLAVVFGPDGEA